MRIGYLYALQAYPPRGGNQLHAYEITQGLIAAGHEVMVLDDPTMPGAKNYNSSDPGAVSKFNESIDALCVRIDARPLSMWHMVRECILLANDKPVVWEINAPANEILAYSWLGGKRRGQPEGILRTLKRHLHAARQNMKIIPEERYRRMLAKHVNGAVCVASALEPYATKALGIANLLTLPNGGPLISEEEILQRRSLRKDKRFTVFYSGSAIYPWQGLDQLSETIHLAASEAPDIRFVLAVNQITDAIPMLSNVEIREKITQDQVINEICMSDVCVSLQPDFLWSPYGFHGSPTKMFEYMACMSPVLASNHSQMKEIFRHRFDGLLCDDSAQSVLENLLWLKNNPEAAAEIGRRGWLKIQTEHNWKQIAFKTGRFMEQLRKSKV